MFKRMVRVGLIFTLLATTLLMPHRAGACSCIYSRFTEEFQKAHAVFLGTVTSVQDPPPSNIVSSDDPITYTFRVHEVFKGTDVTIHKVRTIRDTVSCGAGLDVGETYIVYAFWWDDHVGTYACDLTHRAGSLSIYKWQMEFSVDVLRQQLGFKTRLGRN
jgi:hypothetical protein